MSFHLYVLLFLCCYGAPPATLLTAGALTYPQLRATASNVCTTDAWLGCVSRVPPPQQKSWLRRCSQPYVSVHRSCCGNVQLHTIMFNPYLRASFGRDDCTQVLDFELFPIHLYTDFLILAAVHHDLTLLQAHFHSTYSPVLFSSTACIVVYFGSWISVPPIQIGLFCKTEVAENSVVYLDCVGEVLQNLLHGVFSMRLTSAPLTL